MNRIVKERMKLQRRLQSFFPAKLAFLSNYLVYHFVRSEDLEQDLLHSDTVSLIRSKLKKDILKDV